MSIPQKYLSNLVIAICLTVVVCLTFFGWADFTEALGGVKSFGGLLALIVMSAVVVGGIIYLQGRNYGGWTAERVSHLVIATLVVLILGAIGLSWISLPDGAAMKVLAVIAAHLVAAGLSTFVGELDG
jgi:hypothetical protein